MTENTNKISPVWSRGLLLIKMRWFAFGGALALALFTQLAGAETAAAAATFWKIAAILGVGNTGFHLRYYWLTVRGWDLDVRRYGALFFSQVAVDYLCVSILIYSYGFLNLNLAVLYLPHVILSAIIFERAIAGLIVLTSSLLLVILLTYVHSESPVTQFAPFLFSQHGTLVFVLFNALVFVLVSYLTHLLVAAINKRKNDLIETNAQLLALDHEKQSYTLRATHELKAPFAAIQSYTQVLLGGYLGELEPKVRGIVEKIDARCALLSKMIKSTVQLSNLRTTIFPEADFEPMSINEFMRGKIVSFCETRPEANGRVKYTTALDDDALMKVLPSLFGVMVDHLLDNAIDFSSESAPVTVEARGASEGAWILVISDQGIGIPAVDLSSIFSERFRAPNGADLCPLGNGMGLAIVREAVRLHDGRIEVDSVLEQGTRVELSFNEFSTS